MAYEHSSLLRCSLMIAGIAAVVGSTLAAGSVEKIWAGAVKGLIFLIKGGSKSSLLPPVQDALMETLCENCQSHKQYFTLAFFLVGRFTA